ncbi:sensor histidine kinase [Pseudomarimonas arenosa]|uniref:Sensor histidine kinase n=1 Tax=Pseudomarimonas arenosa TaxID=2774145 RepID=A0AAW3ZVG0_9GAMM|nr:sensor histidine kinase [Pseudomarimonas arenosa]MBD8528026.1 sensor histidine kinase [Pseudomarimonas arenosa]
MSNALIRPDSNERLHQVEQALDTHWFARPSFVLIYLFFVFFPLLFSPRADGLAWGLSLLACVLFILLFRFSTQARPENAVRGLPSALPALLSAGIGYALIPFNPGGNTFLIYAVAMLGQTQPIRRAVLGALLLLGLMSLQFLWVMPTLAIAGGYSLMVCIISAMVLLGVYFAQLQERQVAELKRSRDEVQRLAQSAERERIARDLHDLLGHSLSLIALKSELAGKLIERDPQAARQQIGEIEQVTRQALKQVREAVTGYRSDGLAAEVAQARINLLDADIRLEQHLIPLPIKPEVESTLTMVLREAVTNVLRHAEARSLEIELKIRQGQLCLSIRDDGRGITAKQTEGNGLRGIRERLRAIGGRLSIDSSPGHGTRLDIAIAQNWQLPAPEGGQ